jgi:hypothetical protein
VIRIRERAFRDLARCARASVNIPPDDRILPSLTGFSGSITSLPCTASSKTALDISDINLRLVRSR